MEITDKLASPPEPSADRKGAPRIIQLDSLRGVAAVFVMLHHYTSQYNVHFGHAPGLWFAIHRGDYGVMLFFMISGFVISLTLLRTKRPLDFVVSRVSRLFPTFWFCVFATTAVLWLTHLPKFQPAVLDVLANLTMMPFLLFHREAVDGSYWTLEVELIFYVLMFALLLTKRIGWLTTGMLVLAILSAIETEITQHLTDRLPHLITLAIMVVRNVFILKSITYFACGVALYRMRFDRDFGLPLGLVGASMLSISLRSGLADAGVAILLIAIFAAAVFDRIPLMSSRPLLFLGGISYPLYLIHQYAGYAVIRWCYTWTASPNMTVLVTILFALIAGTAISFGIERPTMRWVRQAYRNFHTRIALPPSP